jgi:beta-lactamase class A
MRISFKIKTAQPNQNVIKWTAVAAASIVILLFSNQITTTIRYLGSNRQATVVTNGSDRWDNDDRVTTPVANFTPLSSNTLNISPPFTRIYQTYGTSNNSLGAPITTAFPSTDGWLQFFANGALLLPSKQQAQTHDDDASLADLAKNGVNDTATGVIRLPLIQTLLSVGSKLPVGGPGSTLTYVDLRKATAPALMTPAPAGYQDTTTNPPSSPQGVFIQGGTRAGKAVGHLIPAAFWNYINQPAISPHSWENDFGAPLTEALTFMLPVNGQTHHMLIQVFSHEALILDQDAEQAQEAGASNTKGLSAIQLLPTGVDYLSTVGMPTVTVQAQQVAWAQSDTALLDTPDTGNPIGHVGQNFPLTLLGDTSWIGGIPWYHIQWSPSKQNPKGWISATALTFNSPGNVSGTASFDALSADLSSYLTNLGSNVGVVTYDLTRQRTYTYNSSTPFITASSIKVPIMLTFLDRIEQQRREPTNNEMALLTTMIENSDNDSATALFNAVGNTAGITTYMQKISINGLVSNDDAWGYSTITPQTMVDLLTLLHNGKILNSKHRALALNLMENVEPDQQIGVGDTAPNKATVALKDGWVTDYDNLWAMNSSGIVTVGKETYIISVYTQEQETLEDGQYITRKVCSTVASLLVP